MPRLAPLALTACLCAFALPAAAKLPSDIRACSDVNEFAPYTYFGKEKRAVTGYSVDVLTQILKNQRIHITLLPWKRCLALAANGEFDLVMDARAVPDRASSFRFSHPYYSVTPLVVFRRDAPPPPLRSLADVGKLRQCQVLGWDYTVYGLAAQSPSEHQPSSIIGALAMLRAGRCQIMLLNQELMPELHFGGQSVADSKELDSVPFPGISKADMHFLVSRTPAHSQALLDALNHGIERMRQAGELERILQRYIQADSSIQKPKR